MAVFSKSSRKFCDINSLSYLQPGKVTTERCLGELHRAAYQDVGPGMGKYLMGVHAGFQLFPEMRRFHIGYTEKS